MDGPEAARARSRGGLPAQRRALSAPVRRCSAGGGFGQQAPHGGDAADELLRDPEHAEPIGAQPDLRLGGIGGAARAPGALALLPGALGADLDAVRESVPLKLGKD